MRAPKIHPLTVNAGVQRWESLSKVPGATGFRACGLPLSYPFPKILGGGEEEDS